MGYYANHLHGIITINDQGMRIGGSRTASTKSTTSRKPLGRLIVAFKTVSTKQINALRNTNGEIVWQRNFFDHIIRNQEDIDRIRRYIQNNPIGWLKGIDKYAPTGRKIRGFGISSDSL
jgi:putative transposase